MVRMIYHGNEEVGYYAACSMYDPKGPSYVHVYPDVRTRLGIPNQPYDWFFDTYREAVEFANRIIGN